jgi:hypothetical protein
MMQTIFVMARATISFLIVGLIVPSMLDSSAIAQEQSCAAKYRFIWGQQSQGLFSTKVDTPCRVRLRMFGTATISSAQIVERPRSGVAAAGSEGTIRFQPKPGFVGTDSITVRYRGTGSAGAPEEATVTFAITVY